jgi:hypothetical protein
MNKNRWIQTALEGHKSGALHRQLGIPVNEKIPYGVLNMITKSKVGERIYINSYGTISNTPFVNVTKLMKKRAILAINLRKKQ